MAPLLWLGFALLADLALGQIHVLESKRCGETECKQYEYCREVDLICLKCDTICDPVHHNFQVDQCERQCQDFLHDRRYLRAGQTEHVAQGGNESNDGSVKLIATAALIISLLLLFIFVAIALIYIRNTNLHTLFKFSKDKKVPEKSRYPDDTPVTTVRRPNDVTVTIPTISEAVRTNNPAPPKQYTNLTTFKNPAPKRPESEPPSATSTNRSNPPLDRRVPSEDSALDFAYDNPAMTPSPVADKVNKSPL